MCHAMQHIIIRHMLVHSCFMVLSPCGSYEISSLASECLSQFEAQDWYGYLYFLDELIRTLEQICFFGSQTAFYLVIVVVS